MKYLFKTTAIFAMATMLSVAYSCNSNEDITDSEALTGETLSLNGNCDYYTLANAEKADWQIVECPAWVTPVQDAGAVTDDIRLYVEELSSTSEPRQGIIRVSYANGVTRAVEAMQTTRADTAGTTSEMKYQRSYATGWSFDVRSYSDSRGLRNQIFNIQKMLATDSMNYTIVPFTDENIVYYFGEDATQLQSDISVKASLGGEYNSFKGEITGNFGRNTLSDSRRVFSWMRTRISCVATMLLETSPSKLQSAGWFTDDFQGIRKRIINAQKENSSELNGLIEQLIESYGTHVVLASYLGGSFDYYYSTVFTKEMSADSIHGGIEASYNEKFNLKGNVDLANSLNNSTTETVEKFTVKGGDAVQLARSVELKDDPQAVEHWKNSLKDGKYELIDYDLRPISMFFPPAVTDEIEDYIEKLYYNELPLTRSGKN